MGVLRLAKAKRGLTPIIRDAQTGRQVKGTSSAKQQAVVTQDYDYRLANRQRFQELAADDFEAMYSSLVSLAQGGNHNAHKIWWEMYVGKPPVAKTEAVPEVVKAFLGLIERQQAPGKPIVDV